MTDTEKPRYRPDLLAALENMMQNWPEVRLGKMFGHPAFYIGRSMFACVYGSGVGLKLPATKALQLKQEAGFAAFRPYGKAEMREWVMISHQRADDYRADEKLLREAAAYAAANNQAKQRGRADER